MKKPLFLLLSLSLLWNCMDDPFENHSLQLEAEAGVTEAWLSLHVEGLKSDAVYTLQRDDTILFNSRLDVADTVIYDSLLTPATSYRYRFFAAEQGETSPAVETALTTMDTTSHDFDWQVYTFGGQTGSSVFYDVAIIDENDIWAVGEIHTAETDRWNEDSTKWIPPYNAAHWDGEKWALVHISPEFRGNKITPEIEGVFAFSTNDIWFCAGGAPVHWNGVNYTMYHLWDMGVLGQTDGGVIKIWGSSSSDIYFVGRTGTIVHYNGTSWTKIESGTDLPIQDIWGENISSGNVEVICAASPSYGSSNGQLLKIEKNKIKNLKWIKNRAVRSIWFKNKNNIFTCGAGVFKSGKTGVWKEIAGIETLNATTERIRGISNNDLFVVGHFGSIMHFNGTTFKVYPKKMTGVYLSCAYKNRIMVSVGFNDSAGYIMILKG